MNPALIASISALIGAAGAVLVNVIKALFGKNSNKELEYQHQEKLIELVSKQNDSSERLIISVEGLRTEVGQIRAEMGNIVNRVDELEKKINT